MGLKALQGVKVVIQGPARCHRVDFEAFRGRTGGTLRPSKRALLWCTRPGHFPVGKSYAIDCTHTVIILPVGEARLVFKRMRTHKLDNIHPEVR